MEKENENPKCGGQPLPSNPPPPPANQNGYWSCINDEPFWVEDLGRYVWRQGKKKQWIKRLKKVK